MTPNDLSRRNLKLIFSKYHINGVPTHELIFELYVLYIRIRYELP